MFKPPTLSPRNSGFIPLEQMNPPQAQQAGLFSPNTHATEHIVEIPLTPVRSNGSGTRKEAQITTRPSYKLEETEDVENETSKKHKPIGRRRTRKKQTGGDAALVEEEGVLNIMGKLYQKIYDSSPVMRYFFYIIPLSLCFIAVILVGVYAAPHATIGADSDTPGVRIVWFFVWLNIVWCSLWISKLIAQALPIIFQTLVGVVSSSVKKYALVIEALEIPISLVGWAVASLCSFIPLMTRNPDQNKIGDNSVHEWQRRMNLVLVACLISSVVFFGQKLIIQIVSVDYHRKQFAHRIKTNKEGVRMLSRLYKASLDLFPANIEFAEEDRLIYQPLAAEIIPMGAFLENINVVHDKVTGAFGNIAQEVTGNKNVFDPKSPYSVVINALTKKKISEVLARRIWMSFVTDGNDFLKKEDLIEVLGPENKQDALECFSSIDIDGNGDISMEEMVMHVTHLHNERKDVGRTMQDVDHAIEALNNVLGFIVFIIVILVFVVCQQSSVGTTLAGAGTVLISLSFVFAATAQEVLGSCIFLFVKHPFDVGDRVDVDGGRYIVEQISLLYSVFKSVDNQKVTQVANNVLNTKWVQNISRSKHMSETISLGVSYDTSFEDIKRLKEKLLDFVKENNHDFKEDLDVHVASLNDLDRMVLKLDIKHKSNWSNGQLTLQRRNKFFCALAVILKEIPIYGAGLGDPIIGEEGKPMYTVSISDDKAQVNIQKQMQSKLSQRWDAENQDGGPKEHRTNVDEAGKSREAGISRATSSATASSDGNVEEKRNIVRTLAREPTRGRRKATPAPAANTQGYEQYQALQAVNPSNNPYQPRGPAQH